MNPGCSWWMPGQPFLGFGRNELCSNVLLGNASLDLLNILKSNPTVGSGSKKKRLKETSSRKTFSNACRILIMAAAWETRPCFLFTVKIHRCHFCNKTCFEQDATTTCFSTCWL